MPIATTTYDQIGLFGDPDGSREDFRNFIEFDPGGNWGGLATQRHDLQARVLVGPKGSGKTIYKRIIEDAIDKKNDVYVFRQTYQIPTTPTIQKYSSLYRSIESARPPPMTSEVVAYTGLYEDNVRTEQWELLWRRAIFLSISSLFYAAGERPQMLVVRSPEVDNFYRDYSALIPRRFLTPESVFNQITDIINRYPSRPTMDRYLNNPFWDSFERTLLRIMRENRPLCIFIDAIDEEFRHAPSQWMDCQKGLFYTVMRLLRDGEIVNSLHVIICIRDLVYSSIIQSSEHATRYTNTQHIRLLNWTSDSAKYFLSKKLDGIPEDMFILKDTRSKGAAEWLGCPVIPNAVRQIEEPIESYLLRHTRLFPRDIVNLGNALSAMCRARTGRGGIPSALDIRNAVSRVAKHIGNEAIRICGNHLAVSSLPRNGINAEFLSIAAEYPVVADWAAEIVIRFIKTIGRDRFPYQTLVRTLRKYQPSLSEIADPSKYMQHRIDTILWQHGLLGYVERNEGHCVFYNTSPLSDFFLPPEQTEYVLHSSLIDAFRIRPEGGIPVAY